MKGFFKWLFLIVFTYLVMHFIVMWSTTEENWNAGQPDHSGDVKMKFQK